VLITCYENIDDEDKERKVREILFLMYFLCMCF